MTMPITYSIDQRSGILTETWTGKVSAEHLAAHWTQLACRPGSAGNTQDAG